MALEKGQAKAERTAREAAALRENLKRRKQQARARRDTAAGDADPKTAPETAPETAPDTAAREGEKVADRGDADRET